MRATWLPDVLKAAGVKVALVPGWETRGREMSAVEGVICHHTAGSATGNAPSLGVVTNGRDDLAGPLSQLVLGRDGTFYVVASGRANHAGVGVWRGVTDGNGRMLGIEAEATGRDAWPEVQMVAYRLGVAAILRHIGRDSGWVCGHKEYALPLGRKPDPNFDMTAFRRSVARVSTTPQEDPLMALTQAQADKLAADAAAALRVSVETRARLENVAEAFGRVMVHLGMDPDAEGPQTAPDVAPAAAKLHPPG